MPSSQRRLAAAMVSALPAISLALLSTTGSAQQQSGRPAPLPLDIAISVQGHNGRSPIDLSPDGEWLLHTIATTDTVPRDSRVYSATGMPFAEGDSRMQATASNTCTGETIVLADPTSSSWAATWSPDGTRVAFFSDAGGVTAVWIWELASRDSRRIEGVVARPFFGFGKPRWGPDSERVMFVALPEGMTVAEANALGPQLATEARRFPEVEEGEASVWVRTHAPEPAADMEPERDDAAPRPIVGRHNDLAVVHLETGRIDRIATSVPVRGYSFSPDGKRAAYTADKGGEPATQQATFDLHVVELESRRTMTLGEDLRLAYGIEYSWSPDSIHVAWFPSGQMARRAATEGEPQRIMLANVIDGSITSIDDPEAPSFDPSDGENRPLWDTAGKTIYAVTGSELWRADTATGTLSRVTAVADWRLRTLVYDWHADTIWSTEDGSRAWAIARAADGSGSAIYAVDLRSGVAEPVLQEPKTYLSTFNVDGSGNGEIAFVSSDQRSPSDLWMFDTDTHELRRASAINPALDRYAMGEARLLHWQSVEGEELGGSLLLPPGYEEGTRLPLVVWVYGGSMGSTAINRFGFWGSMPTFNMHVLATRGYAVLFPDAPVRVGTPARDLIDTVMPGVNAAVAQGYADPERLALMGQSYGSYNTLAMITQTTRFKAAIITAAVLHPDLFADYLDDSTGYYEQGQGNMGGTIWEYPERYLENSPLFKFDQIETPVLIGQGGNDGDLVPTNPIYAALERLDKRVEARVYEGEGHVITQRANVLDFWKRRLEFLAVHLSLDVSDNGIVSSPDRE